MKKIEILLLSILCIALIGSVSLAYTYVEEESTPITKVEITDIDYPYTEGSKLDTSAKISSASHSYISKISWGKVGNLFQVTVTLRPYYDYYYNAKTSATVNGEKASTFVNEDNYLEVSYTFSENASVEKSEGLNSLKHVITVMNSSYGTIIPNVIRAPHGKDYTVQIVPNDGYKIKDVFVDGKSVGAVSEYTFKSVKTTHKIWASYEEIKGYTEKTEETELPLKRILNSIVKNVLDLLNF